MNIWDSPWLIPAAIALLSVLMATGLREALVDLFEPLGRWRAFALWGAEAIAGAGVGLIVSGVGDVAAGFGAVIGAAFGSTPWLAGLLRKTVGRLAGQASARNSGTFKVPPSGVTAPTDEEK